MPLWYAPPFRLYCNAPVPPLAVTVNVVVPPLQAMVPADADAEIATGCETVTEDDVAVHEVLPVSLAVIVYGEPAAFTVNVLDDW